MKLRNLLSAVTLLFLCALSSNAQSTFYAVSPFNSNLEIMDSTTMTSTATIPLTSSTGTVSSANGLAQVPCGPLYIVYKVGIMRYLGTLAPATGFITEIGMFQDNISTIAFANGVLYGVTGDGAAISETLYSINTTTAAMTFLSTLGNGNDGECIAFNPDNGLMYHWSGWGTTSVVMETINLTTLAITPVNLSGSVIGNVGSATYVGNNRFLVSDVNTNGLKYITSAGVVSATSNTTVVFKGLVFANGGTATIVNTTAPNDSICAGDTAVLVCTNSGVTYEWFLDGVSTGNTNDTLNATVAGAYVCEIDYGTCIVASDTIHLTVSNVPTATITPSPTASICNGDSLQLSVNAGGGPAQFQWYVNGVAIPGATTSSYYVSTAGSYNVLKTNQNGCSDSSAVATTITVNNVPTTTITPSPTATFCVGDSIELTVDSGGGNATFQWSFNGADIPGATSSSYFATTAGTYNVTKTNMNGCSSSASVPTVVTTNPLPPVALTPSGTIEFCAGDTVEITITQGSGGGSFQWFLDGSAISGETSSTIFATAEGSYNLQKTNMNGCSNMATVPTVLIDTCSNNLTELEGFTFEVYPNPANDWVRINLSSLDHSDIYQLHLLGLDGKLVRAIDIKEENTNEVNIELSAINSGVYFIRITTNYGSLVKELVIE